VFAGGAHDHLTLSQEVAGIPYLNDGFSGERLNVAEVHLDGGRSRVVFRDVLSEELTGGHEAMEPRSRRYAGSASTPRIRSSSGGCAGT